MNNNRLGNLFSIVSMICVLRGNVGLFRYMHRLVKKRGDYCLNSHLGNIMSDFCLIVLL